MIHVISCALAVLFLFSASASAQQPGYDPHQAFKEADKNHDGYIEMDEFYERNVDLFFIGDRNKDGTLNREEYEAIVVVREDFTKVDQNGDGVLSEAEFISMRVPLFQQADKNHDGKLSEPEVTDAYEAKKK